MLCFITEPVDAVSDSKLNKTGDTSCIHLNRAQGRVSVHRWCINKVTWKLSGENECFQLWGPRGGLMRVCDLIRVPQGWRGRHLT